MIAQQLFSTFPTLFITQRNLYLDPTFEIQI